MGEVFVAVTARLSVCGRLGQSTRPAGRFTRIGVVVLTIHSEHPFVADEQDRDQVRRFRGRLGGAVSLWTAGEERGRVGLTVSSLMVATGEPGAVLGLLDPDSDLAEALGDSGRAVVQLLAWSHRDLADAFAGVAPAPGGPFRMGEWEQTPYGPRLVDAPTWLGVRVESVESVGWSVLVRATIEEVHVGEDAEPLEHRRGRYRR